MSRILNTSIVLALLAVSGGGVLSCSSSGSTVGTSKATATLTPIALPAVTDLAPHEYPGIHNAVAYHEGFLSGSVPEGAAGFDTLARMGVKTVISVDGAEPDVEKASARGIRYIHLPIGYNGFDEQRKLELVRATRDAIDKGPVYIHCHHGKHRSAGAAATIAASLGWATPTQAVERMKVSGTAPGYKGLFACAAGATVLAATTIDAVKSDFPAIARPNGFVKSMIELDEALEHLKAVQAANWTAPSDHPDLSPSAEAGRVADLLRVLADGGRARAQPEDFAQKLRENGLKAQRLEEMLLAGKSDGPALSEQFKLVSVSCKDCHVKYRD